MSELSGAVGSAGPKHKITVGNKQYPISLVTQGVKLAFEKALYEKARAALRSIRGDVDKDYYERKMDGLIEHYQTGGFAMESEFGKKAMESPSGVVLLLALLMGTANPNDPADITPMSQIDLINAVSAAPDEFAAVFKTVIIESFPGADVEKLIAEAEKLDPKAQARASGSSSG